MEGDKVAMELASQTRELLLQALQKVPEGVYASAGEIAEHVSGKHPND